MYRWGMAKPESLGQRIARLRRERGLSMQALALACGRNHRQAIAQWEADESAPRATEIPAICRALRCTSAELLGMKHG